MVIPKKLKIELPNDLVSPLGGIYPKELTVESQRDICTSMFTATFTILIYYFYSQKQLKYSSDE